jgi:hypothetical protein
MVIDDFHGEGVHVGVAGQFLLLAIGLDADGRDAGFAVIHVFFENKDFGFIGGFDLVEVNLPCAVE